MFGLDFVRGSETPLTAMQGHYDPILVILSYIVAVFASYVALEIAHNIRQYRAYSTFWRQIAGAFAMGAGIFTMHFVGMLAYVCPMPMHYDFTLTFTSLVIAVVASGFAFQLIKDPQIKVSQARFIFGGIILGLAIASMHYTGMAAMTDVKIYYRPLLFACSIVIACSASLGALWFMLECEKGSDLRQRVLKAVSACVMGAAICGMHYTGMAASIIEPLSTMSTAVPSLSIDPYGISTIIVFVALLIMAAALLVLGYRRSLFIKVSLGFFIKPLLLIPLTMLFIQYGNKTENWSDEILNRIFPRIQALLEMKGVAYQIQTVTASMQAQQSRPEWESEKNKILAVMAEMDKWERSFTIHHLESSPGASLTNASINELKNSVILSAMSLIEAEETGQPQALIQQKSRNLAISQEKLVVWIEQELAQERQSLALWKAEAYNYEALSAKIFLFMLISIILLSVAINIFIVRQLTTPIFQFRKISKEIAAGNLDLRVPIMTSDEIGELGKNFNEMVEALTKSNQKKDMLLGMAAHDLRNPLSVIMESSEVLLGELDAKATEKQKQLMELIHRASSSMMSLLDDLLHVNAFNVNVFQIEMKKVPLRQFFQSIYDFNLMLARKKKINFWLNTNLEHEYAFFDAAKIDQVVSNLLTNAFKFSESFTRVVLTVKEAGQRLRVEVHDEGLGIPFEEHHKVFVPFSKISVKATNGEPTHGLGLAICRDIIAAHKGTIGFASVPGTGSLFFFDIPISVDSTLPQSTNETPLHELLKSPKCQVEEIIH